MIFTYQTPRKKAYRTLMTPITYRPIEYRLTSKAIPAIMNGELKDMQQDIRQKKGLK